MRRSRFIVKLTIDASRVQTPRYCERLAGHFADTPIILNKQALVSITLALLIGLFLFAGDLVSAQPAAAAGTDKLTFTPVADSYVRQTKPKRNYGSGSALRVDGSPVLRSYLLFDIQGLSGPIETAKLRLFANDSSTTGVDLDTVTDNSWQETSLTYKNAPPIGSVAATSQPFSANTWVSIDVTPLISGNGKWALALTSRDNESVGFASRESGGHAPQLIIKTKTGTATSVATATSTPVPPTYTATPSRTATSVPLTSTPTTTLTYAPVPPTYTSTPTSTTTSTNVYYVSTTGSDANPGSEAKPWGTIQKAVKSVVAGDTIYVHGGQYDGIKNGWVFNNSGTQAQPITLTNYPGEQVVLKIITSSYNDRNIFRCSINPHDPSNWRTPKADYIKIIGTDVKPLFLSNGVESKKGIVMQGLPGEQSSAISVSDCDYWEVAGVDFIETSSGIFAMKNNWQTMEEHSTDHWYVHNNRVYNYYRESGLQFNGDYNRIENNEIYKVSNDLNTPYGCQLLNILGHHNVIRANVLSPYGSTAACAGIRFEWDLADANTVERNLIYDVQGGIVFDGGDNNVIRNNIIYLTQTPFPYQAGIQIFSYDNTKTDWPCDEPPAIVPANDPAAPDYQYYYNPRNCSSYGNQIYDNTIHGFVEGIRLYPLVGTNTIIRNNVFSGWTRGGICFYESSNGTCKPLPAGLIADHNAEQGPFGFVNMQQLDFHLTGTSSLIDAGYGLGNLAPDDFDGDRRPIGGGYDIGAYEYVLKVASLP